MVTNRLLYIQVRAIYYTTQKGQEQTEMTTPIIEARKEAKMAIMLYALELTKAGYNERSVSDSIMSVALDVVLKD